MNAVVEDTLNSLKGNLSGACDTVQSTSRDAVHAATRQIRNHPGAAVGIAAMAGAVLALLLVRR